MHHNSSRRKHRQAQPWGSASCISRSQSVGNRTYSSIPANHEGCPAHAEVKKAAQMEKHNQPASLPRPAMSLWRQSCVSGYNIMQPLGKRTGCTEKPDFPSWLTSLGGTSLSLLTRLQERAATLDEELDVSTSENKNNTFKKDTTSVF